MHVRYGKNCFVIMHVDHAAPFFSPLNKVLTIYVAIEVVIVQR